MKILEVKIYPQHTLPRFRDEFIATAELQIGRDLDALEKSWLLLILEQLNNKINSEIMAGNVAFVNQEQYALGALNFVDMVKVVYQPVFAPEADTSKTSN